MSQIVYLVAGPSGSGKTTLTRALVSRVPHLAKAVTVTTRLPRRGEVPGVDYHFVSSQHFFGMEQRGELLESDHAYNESYGVPRSALDATGDIAIIITVRGALLLKRQLPNAISFFIMPASAETAAARVVERNSPNAESRIASYEAEASASRDFDQVFLNLEIEQTLERMEKVVLTRRRYMHSLPPSGSPLST